MFDLQTLEAADTAVMHVRGPDDEPLFYGTGDAKKPVTITFHAPGSAAYTKAETTRTNRQLSRAKRKIETTGDILRADQIDFLTAATVKFDGLTYGGAAGAEGEDLHRAVYGSRKIGFIADQASTWLNDWSNFTKGSATS